MSRDKLFLHGDNIVMGTNCLKNAPVVLEFDRGTILLTGLSPNAADELSNAVRWDTRVNLWRAPACRYRALVAQLKGKGVLFVDRVREPWNLDGDWTPVTLRPYQEAALDHWRIGGGRGVICLPTGAGKTRLAVAAAQRTGRSILCLVPTRVLLGQWQDAIRQFYSGPIGLVGDGNHLLAPITITTFESAFRSGWTFARRFELLIVDEVHHFGDGERDEALEACPAPFRLGLSATLDEARLPRLEELIGPKLFEMTVGDLVGRGLADFDLSCLHLPLTRSEQSRYETDYEVYRRAFDAFRGVEPEASWQDFVRFARRSPAGQAAISAFHRARRTLAFTEGKRSMLRQLLCRHADCRVLIFTADTASAFALAREFLIAPITADISKSERDQIIADFRAGRLKALVSCKVLNEGWDVPDAEVAIILGGSSADREHIQRIGRVLRPSSETKRAQIYELVAAGTTEVQQSRRRGRKLGDHRREKAYEQE